MTPEQQRIHNILQGQTLLIEWMERARLLAEASKLYATTTSACNSVTSMRIRADGYQLYTKAHTEWNAAVEKEFGLDCGMIWLDGDCLLSCGERYERITL